MSAMTRQEYDGKRVRVLIAGLGLNEADARRQLEREHPKATDAVIHELRFRGLAASEWRVTTHCRLRPDLAQPIVGGSRAWGRQHIDDFAEELGFQGRLMPSAIYRAELGISSAEEQALRRRLQAEKEANHVG